MRRQIPFMVCGLALLLAVWLGLCAGHIWNTPLEVLHYIFGAGRHTANLVSLWRLPRVLTAAIIGFLLGLSGAIFQGVFRNPLAEPWLIGSSGGAAVGATLALLLPWGLPLEISLPLFSFLGAIGATLTVLSLAWGLGCLDTAALLLAGIAVSAILNAVRSFLMLALSDETVSLQVVMSWLMGGVLTPEWRVLGGLTVLAAILFFAAGLFLARPLDLLGLGETMAQAYGLDIKKTAGAALLLGSAMAALAVAVGGLVAFVGLAAPHIGRFFVGTRHKRLLPFAGLVGAIMVSVADALARSLLPPGEIPLGLVTAMAGGPFFIALLITKARRSWL